MQDTRSTTDLHDCVANTPFGALLCAVKSGTFKTITSERSGEFTPSDWRWNNCVIAEQKGVMTDAEPFRDLYGAAWSGAIMGLIVNQLGNPQFGKSWCGTPPPWLYSAAKVEAHSKLGLDAVQAAVSLSELKETVMMLVNPISGAAKFLTRHFFRPTRKFSAKKAAKYCSDKWLEYRYGWLPLASEVESVMDAVYSDRIWRNGGHLRITKGAASTEYKLSAHGEFFVDYSSRLRFRGTQLAVQKVRVSHVVGSKLRTDIGQVERLRILSGLTWGDIPVSLWEGIPFSFVADWWLGVGDWLQAVKPKPYLSIIGEGAATRITTELRWLVTSCEQKYGRSWYPLKADIGSYVLTENRYTRGTGSAWMFPPVKLRIGNVKHILDTLSFTVSQTVANLSRRR